MWNWEDLVPGYVAEAQRRYDRRYRMHAMRRAGLTVVRIARENNISRERVRQLIQSLPTISPVEVYLNDTSDIAAIGEHEKKRKKQIRTAAARLEYMHKNRAAMSRLIIAEARKYVRYAITMNRKELLTILNGAKTYKQVMRGKKYVNYHINLADRSYRARFGYNRYRKG